MVGPVIRPLDIRLDGDAERVRQSHADAIREIQDLPMSSVRVIADVVLPNGSGVQVAHKLGRRPLACFVSPPRGAAATGQVQDFGQRTPTGAPNDLTQTLSLRATGFGADIRVDIMVL